ncbi:MAG TPA: hypothetical protein VF712_20495, partial [Thermoleophilaceae bacterium]
MIQRPPLPDGRYLVVGLARSGVAALEALRARRFEAVGVDKRQGQDGLAELKEADVVVKSPGVPQEA